MRLSELFEAVQAPQAKKAVLSLPMNDQKKKLFLKYLDPNLVQQELSEALPDIDFKDGDWNASEIVGIIGMGAIGLSLLFGAGSARASGRRRQDALNQVIKAEQQLDDADYSKLPPETQAEIKAIKDVMKTGVIKAQADTQKAQAQTKATDSSGTTAQQQGATNPVDSVLDTVLDHEGGYTDNPDDSGNINSNGEVVGTNFGISAEAYEEYFDKVPSAEDMKNLTQDTARQIYKANYIKPVTDNLGIDPSEKVFKQVVDMTINHGYGNTVKIVQDALGIDIDGKSGPGTRSAIDAANPDQLNQELVKSRIKFYNDIVKGDASQAQFLKGWQTRAASFT